MESKKKSKKEIAGTIFLFLLSFPEFTFMLAVGIMILIKFPSQIWAKIVGLF